jgi:PAS domain S-box-containing protein
LVAARSNPPPDIAGTIDFDALALPGNAAHARRTNVPIGVPRRLPLRDFSPRLFALPDAAEFAAGTLGLLMRLEASDRLASMQSDVPALWWRLLLAILCLTVTAAATAAQRTTTGNFVVDIWETEDGLPENSATAMVQTPDDYLWFGTFNGLVRFDGARFTVFDPGNTPALPHAGIVNLHLDRSGALWVSTMKGMARRKDGRWEAIGKDRGWVGNYARTFAENRDGQMYVTTFDGHILFYDGERFTEIVPPEAQVPGNGFLAHVDRQDRLWVVQAGFIGFRENNQWHAFGPQPAANLDPGKSGCGPARDGGMWLLWQDRLIKYASNGVTHDVPLTRPVNGFWSLFEARDGDVWVSSFTDGVFQILTNGFTTNHVRAAGIERRAVRFVFEDRQRNLWIGTSGSGLLRVKRVAARSYGVAEGIDERNVKSVAVDAKRRVWAGTFGQGVYRIESNIVRRVALPGLPAYHRTYVHALLADRADNIWIGTLGQGLLVIPGDSRNAPQEPPPAVGKTVFALHEDGRGRIWAGGHENVVVIDGGATQSFPLAGARAFAEESSGGAMLAATPGGLFRLGPSGVSEVTDPQGRSIPNILCLRRDRHGGTWFGTADRGLGRLRDKTLKMISVSSGLPAAMITTILDDGSSEWWVGSNRGIFRASPNHLNDVADGRQPRLTVQLLGLSDGLPSVECANGQQPTAAIGRTGRVWFGTVKGLVEINSQSMRPGDAVPKVWIESVSYVLGDQRRKELHPGPAGNIELPPGASQIQIDVTAPEFVSPEKLLFAYHLTDKRALLAAEETKSRIIELGQLLPGGYTVNITVGRQAGAWNHVGATLNIVVLPFFWQTVWFRSGSVSALVLAATGLTWQVLRRRTRGQLAVLARQQEVSELQRRLALVLENTSDLVSFTTPEGEITYVNPAGRRLVGANKQSLQSTRAEIWYSPQAWERLRTQALPAAVRDGIWSGESVMRRSDGSEVHVSQVIMSHRDNEGRLQFYSTIARDMTQRKHVEETVLQIARGVVTESSADFFRSLVGHTARALNADIAFVGELHPDKPGTVRTIAVFSDGEPAADFEYGLRGAPCEKLLAGGACAVPDNVAQQFPEDVLLADLGIRGYVGTPLQNGAGTIMGLLVVLYRHPVREPVLASSTIQIFAARASLELDRRLVQQTLAESESRYALAMSVAGAGVWELFPTEGRFRTDRNLPQLLGYAPGELPENMAVWMEMLHPEDRKTVLDLIRGTGAPSDTYSMELRLCRKDGSPARHWVHAQVIERRDGVPVRAVGASLDITARKNAEAKQAALEAQLRQAQKMEAIGTLAGGVAHDFNNMLQAISGYSLLARDPNCAPEKRAVFLREVERAVERAAQLTSQLLAFSRKQNLQKQDIDMSRLVPDMLRMVRRLLGETIEVDFLPAAGLGNVRGDKGQLDQVVLNLCVNARDAMPRGGRITIRVENVTLDPSIKQRYPWTSGGPHVRLSVADTGIGMDPATIERIFEPFFTTKGVAGTGLGLAMVYGIVQQHEGIIEVQSEPGSGSTFTIYLPVTDRTTEHGIKAVPGKPPGGTETILVVEDDTAVRELARTLFCEAGYTVLIAQDGEEAVQTVRRSAREIDLVFMDVVMPRLGGIEAYQQINLLAPRLPVIFCSGYTGPAIHGSFELPPGTRLVAKPYAAHALLHTLREVLDERKNDRRARN